MFRVLSYLAVLMMVLALATPVQAEEAIRNVQNELGFASLEAGNFKLAVEFFH